MTTTTTDSNDIEASGFGVRHISATARSEKRQAWPPTDHLKRLLEKAYPNHTYSIKHKLKDYDMMKSFMISGSPSQGMELDEDPGGSDTMLFPGKNTVMMVYNGHPLQGCVVCLSWAPDPRLIVVGGMGA
jgi:hypothetical protein